MNPEEPPNLRSAFRPGEVCFLAGSAMARKRDAASFVNLARNDLTSGGVFQLIIEKHRVNPGLLLHKLAVVAGTHGDVDLGPPQFDPPAR